MKKLLLVFAVLQLTVALRAQQHETTRLIVRADDMGSSHSANQAIIKCYTEGIVTSGEVMVVTPWFPEAVRLLNENRALDVGLHLVLTSEWDNIKWRPLTHCPGLTDKNGYFFPMMWPNPNYPGQAVMENKWTLNEIEQEFRAQIELALINIPQITHISGHMGVTDFNPEVEALTNRLASEYNLIHVCGKNEESFGISGAGYNNSHTTSAEKESAFIGLVNTFEAGKMYMFLDHPAFDDSEMQAVHHIGYENVAADRQGVVDLFTSPKVKLLLQEKNIQLISYNDATRPLTRSNPDQEQFDTSAVDTYLEAVARNNQDLHSLMILRHGKVIAEHWAKGFSAYKNHVLHSVSKAFTSTAIGFAVAENRLRVTDKVISFFPDILPDTVSEWLAALDIRDLLTMTSGFDIKASDDIRNQPGNWEKLCLSVPITSKPGEKFIYNSMNTYLLSAILKKVTGQNPTDYLYPRLFRPLGIAGVVWEKNPEGIEKGGWGLHAKTEDLAKLGQFYLQRGKWEGKQLLPESWFDEATTASHKQAPQWVMPGTKAKDSDWMQGYGYQLWRCRHNAYRADGAYGQFIIVIPGKDAVIVTTANIAAMQDEINLIWEYLLPAFR